MSGFLVFEFVVGVNVGFFGDEGEKFGLNLIGSFAFGLNGGYVIPIIISKNHVIGVNIETFSHRVVFLLFFHHFPIFFACCHPFTVAQLVISRIIFTVDFFFG